MAKWGFSQKQIEQYALPRYNLKQIDDLYAGIGGGDIKLHQLSHYLQSKLIKPTAEQADEAVLKQLNKHQNQKAKNGQIIIDGVGNLMHSIVVANRFQVILLSATLLKDGEFQFINPIANNYLNYKVAIPNEWLKHNGGITIRKG